MHNFDYHKGELHAERVSISDIADQIGTPFYCYSSNTILKNFKMLSTAFEETNALICYSVKANSNQAVISTLVNQGAGCDVISGGELQRALTAGCPANRIIFAGPGKTSEELAAALKENVHQINVESENELILLSDIAAKRKIVAPVALRINPDVTANTHDKISTGRKEDKFGVGIKEAPAVYDLGRKLPGVEMLGLAMHIGSQLTTLKPFELAFRRGLKLIDYLRADGHNISRFNMGGGLGIKYLNETPPHPNDYAALIKKMTTNYNLSLAIEPGRMIVGDAGLLVTRVIYEKTGGKRFVFVDAAMNDFIRPTLYESIHEITPVSQPKIDTMVSTADVVGPICESGDFLALEQELPQFSPGQLIAVRTTGAYGAVMASNYNSRPLIAEVLVKDNRYSVIRPRQTIEDLISRDELPEWLDVS